MLRVNDSVQCYSLEQICSCPPSTSQSQPHDVQQSNSGAAQILNSKSTALRDVISMTQIFVSIEASVIFSSLNFTSENLANISERSPTQLSSFLNIQLCSKQYQG